MEKLIYTPTAPDRDTQPLRYADDLTRIQGIGPLLQRALNNAGIWTFYDLAAADLSLVRGVANYCGGDAEDWQDQARRLGG